MNNGQLKALLFDLGGTLLYPDYPFIRKHFAAQGLDVEQDMFLHALSVASNRLDTYMRHHQQTTDATRTPVYMRYILEELNAPFPIDSFIEETVLPYHRTVSFWNYLLEGTLSLLDRLRQRYSLAIISNSDGRAEAKAQQYGLSPYMVRVIDSHYVGVEKPDPRIFHLACEQLQLAPSECAYIGDIYSIDVLGAKAAGLLPILIDKTLTPRTDCHVIGSLFDLEKLSF